MPEKKPNAPGSRTRMAFAITCKIAVHWKKGAAPIVVPGIRVEIASSVFAARVATYYWLWKTHAKLWLIRTLDTPGEGLASVLIITVSCSLYVAFSYDVPFTW